MKKVVGIRFKEAGKIYYFDPCNFSINKNDNVIVETSRGIEYGNVAIEPREVEESKDAEKTYEIVEDDTELMAVSKVFEELLEDVDIEM